MLSALPLVVAIFALGVGRYSIAFGDVVHLIVSKLIGRETTLPAVYETIVFQVRLPRVLSALMIGAGLSIAGAALQGMFSNPLVSSDILGVSAGAGFGASLGIILFGTGLGAQAMALVFGLFTIALIYLLIGGGAKPIYMIVLAGVIVSSLFQALISLVKFVADPEDKLPAITYWLMGSLSNITHRDVFMAAPLLIGGIVVLLLLRWRINLLSLPEDELKSLGISIGLLRALIIFSSTLIVAISVAMGGIIGWVGLVIPHISRMLVGSNNQHVLPMSVILGSSYLLLIDVMARSFSAVEIPISILTALIGAPFFAILLKRLQGSMS
jgi:iron complex transport system permease protein